MFPPSCPTSKTPSSKYALFWPFEIWVQAESKRNFHFKLERKRHIGNDIVTIVFQDLEDNDEPDFTPSSGQSFSLAFDLNAPSDVLFL